MEETLEKCIPPKSILLQILQGLAPNQANVTGLLKVKVMTFEIWVKVESGILNLLYVSMVSMRIGQIIHQYE